MTLLELTVAMGIFAVITVGLYGTFGRTAAGRDAAMERSELVLAARAILERIGRDLQGSMNTGRYTHDFKMFFVPEDSSLGVHQSARTVLELTTASARGVASPEGLGWQPASIADRGDQARVTWRLDSQARLLRYEQRPPAADPIVFEESRPELVAEGVRSLTLRLWGEPDRQWRESWDSGRVGQMNARAPRLAEIRVVLVGPDDEDFELLDVVRLPTGGADG